MTLQIREWLIESENEFDYRQSVSIYPDNNRQFRDDLFFDVEGEACGMTIAVRKY